MVNVLKCPVCDCDVLLSQQESLVAPSMTNELEAGVIVCYCPESHRFVTSLKKILSKASSA